MEARIYLRTSYHGLRKAEGCYCGILEADTSEGEKTLEETGKDTGTANQIALLGLIKAMNGTPGMSVERRRDLRNEKTKMQAVRKAVYAGRQGGNLLSEVPAGTDEGKSRKKKGSL